MRFIAQLEHIPMSRVRQNVIIAGRPGLTATRALAWLMHCLAKRPATINSGGAMKS